MEWWRTYVTNGPRWLPPQLSVLVFTGTSHYSNYTFSLSSVTAIHTVLLHRSYRVFEFQGSLVLVRAYHWHCASDGQPVRPSLILMAMIPSASH